MSPDMKAKEKCYYLKCHGKIQINRAPRRLSINKRRTRLHDALILEQPNGRLEQLSLFSLNTYRDKRTIQLTALHFTRYNEV